jgi:hypothetical protein
MEVGMQGVTLYTTANGATVPSAHPSKEGGRQPDFNA